MTALEKFSLHYITQHDRSCWGTGYDAEPHHTCLYQDRSYLGFRHVGHATTLADMTILGLFFGGLLMETRYCITVELCLVKD